MMRHFIGCAIVVGAALGVPTNVKAQAADQNGAGVEADARTVVQFDAGEVGEDLQAEGRVGVQQDPTLNQDVNVPNVDFEADAAGAANAQTPLGLDADVDARLEADADGQNEPALDAQADADVSAQADARSDRRAEQWRYRRHNGEWWYWMPGEYWMYHRNGQWTRYNPDTFVRTDQSRRYVTGYRGTAQTNDGSYYYGPDGRRYFDDGRGYVDSRYYFDPYGNRFYNYGGRRYYNDNSGSYYWDGNRRVYDSGVVDPRYRNPGFRRGANLGGSIGEAIGGDVGGAIGAEIGGAIGD